MKYCFFVLITAVFLSSCFKDPPATTAYMTRAEMRCNNPWGKADTTNNLTIRKWLYENKIQFEHATISSDTVSAGILYSNKCDTLTGRFVYVFVVFADTAKAAKLGLQYPH